MFFQHIYDKSLAQSSYLIGCQATGESIVIDAKRDIDTYLQIAKENNLRITHITETHIHADFLAGSRELVSVSGAKLYLSDEGGPDWQYEFPHQGLRDGDIIKVGNLSLKVLHTPGHTPESISFLLTDHPASNEPVMIFTGDFVFVGDIGRPDLLEKAAGLAGTKEPGARQMFQSLKKFMEIPDHVQLWSAHGAGSACGKSLGDVPVSTAGYEKIRNWAFQYLNNEDLFVNELLEGQPEAPRYFAKMKSLNKVSRPLLTEVPIIPKLSSEQFLQAYTKGIKVIDTRHKSEFAKGFLPYSYNIQANNALSTWAGWIMNYEEQFILIADESRIEDISRMLMRIGLDNVYGFISDINEFNIVLNSVKQINTQDLRNKITDKSAFILDVRGENEFHKNHIPQAINLFVGTLESHLDLLDSKKEVIVYCQGGDRSSLAYSILAKNGFDKISNYSGGMNEWMEAEKPAASYSTSSGVFHEN